jgi:hypothetical protein
MKTEVSEESGSSILKLVRIRERRIWLATGRPDKKLTCVLLGRKNKSYFALSVFTNKTLCRLVVERTVPTERPPLVDEI